MFVLRILSSSGGRILSFYSVSSSVRSGDSGWIPPRRIDPVGDPLVMAGV